MQINGLREFSSQIASLNGLTGMQNSSFLRGLTEQNQTSVARDSLILSETGKRFSLNTEKSLSLTQTQEEEQDISNPALKLMDEGLTEAKAILEKMHELASLATQQDLTDLERVEIQIEIEDLRRNLDSVSANLGLRAQKMGGLPVEEPVEIPTPGNLMSLNRPLR